MRVPAIARRHLPRAEVLVPERTSIAPVEGVWRPNPGPQSMVFAIPRHVTTVLFGGGRSGGKSEAALALCADFVQRHGGPEGSALVLRTEFKQLRDLRERGKVLFKPLGAKWVGGDESCFRFPGGARVTLGHARTELDVEKWNGWEIGLCVFEEAQNWPNDIVLRKLVGSVRTSVPGMVPRVFLTAMPGGRGHGWLKAQFVADKEPFRLYPEVDDEGRPVTGADGQRSYQCFIPSLLEDNPALLRADKSYVAKLKRLPAHLRDAWLYGSWDANPDAYLSGIWDPAVHIVEDFPAGGPPASWPRWAAIDWGFAAPYAVLWLTKRPDGAVVVYRERYGWGGKPNVGARRTASEVARLMFDAEEVEPPDAHRRADVADASMWAEDGKTRGASIAQVFADAGRRIEPGPKGRGSRKATLGLLVDRLRDRTLFVTKSCKHWLRTVPVIAPDPDDAEDVDTEAEDHAIDATRYGLWSWHSRYAVREPAAPKPPKVASMPRIEGLAMRTTAGGMVPAPTADDIVALMRGKHNTVH